MALTLVKSMATTRYPLAVGALVLLLASCGVGDSAADSHSDTMSSARVQEPDTSRVLFWMRFRDAVANSDTAVLLRLTSRTFETRGELDGAPWVPRDSAGIVALLDSLLDADPGTQAAPATMRDLVRRTTVLDSTAQSSPDEFRVGAFLFSRMGGQWRFAKAYLPQ